MFEIFQSETFAEWLSGLRDRNARARIQTRIDRMATGNLGDVAPIGGGLSEARAKEIALEWEAQQDE